MPTTQPCLQGNTTANDLLAHPAVCKLAAANAVLHTAAKSPGLASASNSSEDPASDLSKVYSLGLLIQLACNLRMSGNNMTLTTHCAQVQATTTLNPYAAQRSAPPSLKMESTAPAAPKAAVAHPPQPQPAATKTAEAQPTQAAESKPAQAAPKPAQAAQPEAAKVQPALVVTKGILSLPDFGPGEDDLELHALHTLADAQGALKDLKKAMKGDEENLPPGPEPNKLTVPAKPAVKPASKAAPARRAAATTRGGRRVSRGPSRR